MKHQLLIFCVSSMSVCIYAYQTPDYNIILKAQWHNLEEKEDRSEKFGGKWILAGHIIFKKKAKDSVHLSKLYLQWRGQHIDQLFASLYTSHDMHTFLPIQENLVCDGLWNKHHQMLLLNFDKSFSLGPSTIFYLVLTVPTNLEKTLQQGSFHVLETHLPEQYKICARQQPLSLVYSSIQNSLPQIRLASQ